jgi:hypothetical protein
MAGETPANPAPLISNQVVRDKVMAGGTPAKPALLISDY